MEHVELSQCPRYGQSVCNWLLHHGHLLNCSYSVQLQCIRMSLHVGYYCDSKCMLSFCTPSYGYDCMFMNGTMDVH